LNRFLVFSVGKETKGIAVLVKRKQIIIIDKKHDEEFLLQNKIYFYEHTIAVRKMLG